MRVSDRSTARNYLKYLNTAKSAISKTQQQLASGNRFERISDDVSSGTKVMRSRMDLYTTEKHLDNVKSVNEELTTLETSVKSMNDLLSSAHAIALRATSENNQSVAKDPLANEIKNIKEQILYLANTKFGKKFVFGGSNSSLSQPFTMDKDTGKIKYNGVDMDSIQKDADGYFWMDGADRKPIPMDEDVYMDVGLGVRMNASQIDGDTGFLISHSGIDILGFGTDPATGLSNNIFNVLSDMEKNIREYDSEKIGKLDTQLSTLSDRFRVNLTDIGSKTSFLDIMQSRLEENVDSYKIKIDNLMGVNEEEAATTQMMNDAILKSILQMGARLFPVTLMDFLN